MKEDIKIIEENIDYNSLIFGNGNAELSEKLRNAIRHLLQAYKEEVKTNTDVSILNAELSFKIGRYEEQIKQLEKENKNLKDIDLSCVYLNGVYDGKEQATIDSTPNSVIREKMKEIKIKGNKAEKTKENVMFYQGYYIALEEISKKGEK